MLRVSRQLSWGKLLLVFVIIAAAAMLSSTTSFAAVTSTNANVDLKAPPPSSVLESDNANSSEIWIFQEKSVSLGSALAIDQANTNPSTTIASGTTINSYFIHLGKGGSSGLSGTVTFDEPILGVIKVNSKLDATDFLLGLPGTTYQVGNFRGLENNDSISFDDEFTINFTLNTPSHADQIRVITETVGAVTLLPPGHTWEYTFIDPTGDSSWNTSTGGWFTGPAPFGIPPGLNPSPLFFPGTVWDADISPIIVDIHAVENHPGNKVSVTLPPGSYDLTVIGPDDGGAFEAWNAWGRLSPIVTTMAPIAPLVG